MSVPFDMFCLFLFMLEIRYNLNQKRVHDYWIFSKIYLIGIAGEDGISTNKIFKRKTLHLRMDVWIDERKSEKR